MLPKKMNIDEEISVVYFGELVQFKLKLDLVSGSKMIMALLLLKEKLVDTVAIKFTNYQLVLRTSGDHYSYWEPAASRDGSFKGRISIDQLEYIQYYILKFYRDGVPKVDHIDIDFGSKDKEATWTISCFNSGLIYDMR